MGILDFLHHASDRAASKPKLSKLRRVGKSKKRDTCDQCGKTGLTETSVFERSDGTRVYLGSECAKGAGDMAEGQELLSEDSESLGLEYYKPHDFKLSDQLLAEIHTKLEGRVGSYQVYSVDGSRVRAQVDIDFVAGGNAGRYKYVPLDEIWVEHIYEPVDFAATLLHEIVEADLMLKSGQSYDQAHETASRREAPFRRSLLENEGAIKSRRSALNLVDAIIYVTLDIGPTKLDVELEQLIGSKDKGTDAAELDSPAFKNLSDLETYLHDFGWRHGWSRDFDKEPTLKDYKKYVKKYGRITYRILIDDSIWQILSTKTSVWIWPTTWPAGIPFEDSQEKEDAINRIRSDLDISGLTFLNIERKIEELVKNWKELAGPRKKVDTKYAEWRPKYDKNGKEIYIDDEDPLLGEEAVKAWKRDISIMLLETVDSYGREGVSIKPDTSLLIGELLENRSGWELDGMRRKWIEQTIVNTLESMAKKNLIEKSYSPTAGSKGKGATVWVSKRFVPKKSYW